MNGNDREILCHLFENIDTGMLFRTRDMAKANLTGERSY